MPENKEHTWQKVYVIQRMRGRGPKEDRKIEIPGEMWSAFFGLRDDGLVFYSQFHNQESHAIAEAQFKPGAESFLNDAYCDRLGMSSGWRTNDAEFMQHCTSLAATSVPDDRGIFSMVNRTDLEGEQESHAV